MRKPAPAETINGTRYEVTPLGALKGREVLVRLMNLLGPGLSNLIRTWNKDAAPEVAAALFADLAARIADDDLRYLVEAFAPGTQVQTPDMKGPGVLDGQRIDDHYAANYGELFQWLWLCIQVNYKSFLAGAPGVQGLMSRAPASSSSPST